MSDEKTTNTAIVSFDSTTDIRFVTLIDGTRVALVGCTETSKGFQVEAILAVQMIPQGDNSVGIAFVPYYDTPETSTGPHAVPIESILIFHTLLPKGRERILERANELMVIQRSKKSGLILPPNMNNNRVLKFDR